MRRRSTVIVGFVLLLVSGAAFSRGPLENIPLKWSPTSPLSEMGALDVSGALLTTKIRIDAFVDTRQNPSLIAENREKADKVRQVTTSDDVGRFLTDHLKESLHGAGLNTVDSGGDVSLSGEIRQFFVTEESTYNGQISLLLHVKNAAGKELWSGIVNGDATRWGRSYSAGNYYEAISKQRCAARGLQPALQCGFPRGGRQTVKCAAGSGVAEIDDPDGASGRSVSPKNALPTRANRAAPSVASQVTAPRPAGGAPGGSGSVFNTAAAVVAAESTMVTWGGRARRMAPASAGKCVQPSSKVSGAPLP